VGKIRELFLVWFGFVATMICDHDRGIFLSGDGGRVVMSMCQTPLSLINFFMINKMITID
jgi:hypothetical protein